MISLSVLAKDLSLAPSSRPEEGLEESPVVPDMLSFGAVMASFQSLHTANRKFVSNRRRQEIS